jgi:hypothetical protein
MRNAASVALFVLALRLVPAQELEAALARHSDRIEIGFVLTGIDEERLLGGLQDGLAAGVKFQFRIYTQAAGILRLLGDRLVSETSVVRTASMDFLEHRYILVGEEGSTESFQGAEEFLSRFLSVSPFVVPAAYEDATYVMARARLDYVKLEPPLNLVALFQRTAVTTDWWRVELPAHRE